MPCLHDLRSAADHRFIPARAPVDLGFSSSLSGSRVCSRRKYGRPMLPPASGEPEGDEERASCGRAWRRGRDLPLAFSRVRGHRSEKGGGSVFRIRGAVSGNVLIADGPNVNDRPRPRCCKLVSLRVPTQTFEAI